MAKEVNDGNFQEEVLESSIPVLVDFWAPWCGPCQMVGPVISKLAEEYEGKVKVVKYNVQDHQDFAGKYGIQGIPAFKVFKGGEVVGEGVGVMPETKLKEMIDTHV